MEEEQLQSDAVADPANGANQLSFTSFSSQDDVSLDMTCDSRDTSMVANKGSFTEDAPSLSDYEFLMGIQTPDVATTPAPLTPLGDRVVTSSCLQEGEEREGQPEVVESETPKQETECSEMNTKTMDGSETECDATINDSPCEEDTLPSSETKPCPEDPDKTPEGEHTPVNITPNPPQEKEETELPNPESLLVDPSKSPSRAEQHKTASPVTGSMEQPTPPKEDVPPNMDQSSSSNPHNTTGSIYLSDEEEKKQPPQSAVVAACSKPTKRMTMAQRAAMEALATFGGSDFSSLRVKKRDLRSELKRDAEKMKSGNDDGTTDEQPPAKRPRTRLQRAQQEAEDAFKDIPLGERKGAEKRSTSSQHSIPGVRSKSRVQRAREEAMASFGGESLDSIAMKRIGTSSTTTSVADQPPPTRRLTRVERARMEALQTFGGHGFGDVMVESKRRVARTLEVKKPEGEEAEKENEEENAVAAAVE